jgi:hypothetical protein
MQAKAVLMRDDVRRETHELRTSKSQKRRIGTKEDAHSDSRTTHRVYETTRRASTFRFLAL